MKAFVLALSIIAAFAFALPLSITAVDLSGSPEEIEAQKAQWIDRLSEKQSEVANAKARHAQALAAYQRMRTRNTSRGQKRVFAVEEMKAAEAALADAEAALEGTLAEARREGVPPGWIRDATHRRNAAPASRD
jgi:hypothetical protein